MNILVVSQYFWPENFRINDLASELVVRGHDVTVLTGVPNYPDGKVFKDFHNDPDKFSEYNGVQIVRVPMFARGSNNIRLLLNYLSFAFNSSVFGLWKLRKKNFDLIFVCQLSPVTIAIPGIIFRKIKKVPMLLWVLDLWPDTLKAVGVVRSDTMLKLVSKLVRAIYNNSDLILAQSKSFIPQIKKLLTQKCEVEYFPSWAEPDFDCHDVLASKEIPFKKSMFTIIFAGNIGDAQDFPTILDAVSKLRNNKNIRWLIIGSGRREKWVANEIIRRKLQDCISMLGRHPTKKMPSFFKHADALLISLKDEPIFAMTLPGKMQAYLKTGIPIMAMLNGEGAEVIRNAKAGLTCLAGDHDALADTVLAMSKMSNEERRIMGKNGIKLSKLEFDRNNLISKLESWFIKVSLK